MWNTAAHHMGEDMPRNPLSPKATKAPITGAFVFRFLSKNA